MSVRLLHTADVHLDVEFHHSPGKGDAYRQRIWQAFRRIVDMARDGHDLMIVAGDLFDNNRPYAATVDFVRDELARAGIPVCLLAGNHDHLDHHSVYSQHVWPANVHVFQERGEQYVLPDKDLVVTGFPLSERPGDCIQDEPPALTRPAQHHVAVMHGWVFQPYIGQTKQYLQLKALRPQDVDYIALGHLHRAGRQQLAVETWYSGAPEPVQAFQDEYGVALSVELGDAGVQVSPCIVGKMRKSRLEVNMQGLDAAALDQRISHARDPDRIVTVVLTGLRDSCPGLDVEALQSRWQASFFSLRIRDQTQVSIALDQLPDGEQTPILKEFARLMRARLETAHSVEEKTLIRQAYDLGLNELQGRKVV